MPCQLDEKNGQTDAADVSLTILTESPYTEEEPTRLRITGKFGSSRYKKPWL